MKQLAIHYRSIGLLATCLGNERLRIERDGHVYHARNSRECATGQRWSDDWREEGRLDSDAMAQLHQAILSCGLLALPTEIIDETVEGGRREELDLAFDDAEYGFVLQNCDRAAFREAVKLLWGALATAQSVNHQHSLETR